MSNLKRRHRMSEEDEHPMKRIQELVLDQIHDWVTITDLDGRISYVNDAQCRALGRSKFDLVGTHVFSYGEDPVKGATRREVMERTLSEGRWRGEVVHHSADGDEIVLECRTVQVRDGNRRPIALAGIATDITERKKAEEALRQSEEKYKNLFNVISDAIFLNDAATGQILDANRACVSLYGYSQGELLQMSIFDLSSEPEETRKALDSRQAYVPLRYNRKKDGTLFPVEIMAGYQEWEGREIRIGVVRDITARVRMQEERERLERQLRQAQKMEAVGTLAGGIAHDFNNILGVILGCSELLLLKAQPSEREPLEQICWAGERARDLVRQILAFSRQSEQLRGIVRVDLVVNEAMNFLRSSLPSTIEIRTENGKEVRVLADPTQVHQIVMNLCVNAAHAMMENGGVLTVEVDELEAGNEEMVLYGIPCTGRYCILRVSDTGGGMSRRVMERIFEPYFTTKKPGEGTGLGLSVAHGIVKSYGGGITVESALNKGTTFHVMLPVSSPALVSKWQTQTELQKGKGERLLLIDDEEMLAATMKRLLEELGYEVVVRTSSLEALDAFQSHPGEFDLVITDMTMPHMTGLDLAKRFMEIRPDTPVILCTGYSEDAALERMGEAGIRKLVMKPIVLRDLAASIRQVLGAADRKAFET